MDKHADPIDKASALADMYNEQGLTEVRRRNAPEQVQNEDGTWPNEFCVDCGDDIPEQRLALGRVRCFPCQELKEKRNKQYGR